MVENRELRLDGHTMRDVRPGTYLYAVYNMAAETKCPFRRPELPCSFYYGWDDNRTRLSVWSRTILIPKSKPFPGIPSKPSPNLLEPWLKSAIAAAIPY